MLLVQSFRHAHDELPRHPVGIVGRCRCRRRSPGRNDGIWVRTLLDASLSFTRYPLASITMVIDLTRAYRAGRSARRAH